MSEVLNKATVLVLNRNWQAINVRTPAQAFCQMATDVATALHIESDDEMYPVMWSDWLKLPVREGDNAVKTTHGPVRIPTVIVLAKFSRVPMRRPSLSAKGVWERDGGTCQYTGRKLSASEGNLDHVVPRSRGGVTSWGNVVLAHKEVNSMKADRTPEEAGLKLVRQPVMPKELPMTVFIRNSHQIRDWERFLLFQS